MTGYSAAMIGAVHISFFFQVTINFLALFHIWSFDYLLHWLLL